MIQRDGERLMFSQVIQLGNGKNSDLNSRLYDKTKFLTIAYSFTLSRFMSCLPHPAASCRQTRTVSPTHPPTPRPSTALVGGPQCGPSGTFLDLFGLPICPPAPPEPWLPWMDIKEIWIQIPAQPLPSNMALGELTFPQFLSAFLIIRMGIQLLVVVRIK